MTLWVLWCVVPYNRRGHLSLTRLLLVKPLLSLDTICHDTIRLWMSMLALRLSRAALHSLLLLLLLLLCSGSHGRTLTSLILLACGSLLYHLLLGHLVLSLFSASNLRRSLSRSCSAFLSASCNRAFSAFLFSSCWFLIFSIVLNRSKRGSKDVPPAWPSPSTGLTPTLSTRRIPLVEDKHESFLIGCKSFICSELCNSSFASLW